MRYISGVMILGLAIFTGCQQVSTQPANNLAKNTKAPAAHDHDSEDDATRISLKDAKAAYDAGTAVIVDSRDINAYKSERIKGSISMPVGEMEKRIGELPKDKQLIFYCS